MDGLAKAAAVALLVFFTWLCTAAWYELKLRAHECPVWLSSHLTNQDFEAGKPPILLYTYCQYEALVFSKE